MIRTQKKLFSLIFSCKVASAQDAVKCVCLDLLAENIYSPTLGFCPVFRVAPTSHMGVINKNKNNFKDIVSL